ncbi:RHS repeat-associated core domain-containing protein [bacterium]|nr:RHS repeat-associated core domain-containing protein [bacterium]
MQTMVYNPSRQLLRVQASNLGSVDGHIKSIGRTYDTLARLIKITSFENENGTGTVRNEIELAYDGLGNVISSKQSHEGVVGGTTPTVQYAFDATAASNSFTNNHRLQSVTYPNGRVVFYDYGTDTQLNDRLSRVLSLRNANASGSIWTTYAYNGESRLALASYPQINVSLDYLQGTSGTYAGYDRFGRIKDQRWRNTSTSTDLDRYQYGYDFAGNRLWRDNPVATAFDRDWLYAYDSSHRLDVGSLGQLNTGRTGLTSTFGIQDWTLDSLGNWSNFQQTVLGNIELTQSRAHNKANEVGTITNSVGAAWAAVSHDAAGNMTAMPKSDDEGVGLTCTYDAWNRLVKVINASDSTTVAEYEYDGLNRRIVKSNGTGTVKDHFYFNEDWQELEVRKETSPGTIIASPFEQFVWHPYYIDALATRFYDANTTGSQTQHYFTHDANFNITAAIDTSGAVVERYDYTPYGQPFILEPNFSADPDGTDIGNGYLYTGRYYDRVLGLYHYRHRTYDPAVGTFLTRDPIGYEGSPWNLYEYASSQPSRHPDPLGLACKVYFRCTLTANVLNGCTRNCSYLCNETGRQNAGIGGVSCNEVPAGQIITSDTSNTSYLCAATNGLCGTPSDCGPPYDTSRVYINDNNIGDCSKASCRRGCESIYNGTSAACELSRGTLAQQACIAAAEAAKQICLDGCNSVCKND